MLRPAVNLLRLMPTISATRLQTKCQNEMMNQIVLSKGLHLTSTALKSERRDLRSFRQSMPTKYDYTSGENTISIDGISEQTDIFPDVNTPNRLFEGIPYVELPVVNIKACKNNTIISLADHKGMVGVIWSCGTEGFKHSRKGTNVAAQTTAINLSSKIQTLGVRTVKVRVQGIGPGRLAAIKGLQMGGINIVSITDNTHVSWSPRRPRKQRRV